MANFRRFVSPENTFSPETIAILEVAYERAIATLHDNDRLQAVREIVARRIITLAMKGERNPERLFKIAVADLPE